MVDAVLKIGIEFVKADLKTQLNSLKSQITSQVSNMKSLNTAATTQLKTSQNQVAAKKQELSVHNQIVQSLAEQRQLLVDSRNAKGVSSLFDSGQKQQVASAVADFNKLKQESAQLVEIQATIGKSNPAFRQQSELVRKLGKDIGFSNIQMTKLAKSQKKFSFDFLTFIFAGQALKRVFGGALRNIIDNYKKMTGLNSEFNKRVLKLSASFNFLKFAIGNALNNPIVIAGIEFLIDIIEFLGDVIADNQGIVTFILGVAAALAVLGAAALGVGGLLQFGLLVTATGKLILGALLSPWILISAAILGTIVIGLLLIATFETYREKALSASSEVVGAFKDLGSAIKDSLLSLFGFDDSVQGATGTLKAMGAVATTAFQIASLVLIEIASGIQKLIASFKIVGRGIQLLIIEPLRRAAKAVVGIFGFLGKDAPQALANFANADATSLTDTLDGINDDLGEAFREVRKNNERQSRILKDLKTPVGHYNDQLKKEAGENQSLLRESEDQLMSVETNMSKMIGDITKDSSSLTTGLDLSSFLNIDASKLQSDFDEANEIFKNSASQIFEEGGLQSGFESMTQSQEELNKQVKSFGTDFSAAYSGHVAPSLTSTEFILSTIGNTIQTKVLDRWEQWQPSEKNLVLRITRIIETKSA